MDNQIQEVKTRIDIVDYIGQRIALSKAGRNFRALCPFHQEKSASFIVSPDRQRWHCFGACHEGGDVISFAMKWENITFIEALRELAEMAGITLKDFAFEDKAYAIKDRILRVNTLAAKYYSYVLHDTEAGAAARNYLSGRGFSDAIINTFQLGYAPRSWDSLKQFFEKRKIAQSDALEAGLFIQSQSGRVYDRFRGRVMFPLSDMRGDIIGFSGRLLIPSEREGKYINSPETPLYHKRETLYGIHLTKNAIRKANEAIIVEGEFDMISPFMHGFSNVVAIKGSAVTAEQLAILKRFTKRIILALDADEAGADAMHRGITEAEKFDFEVRIVTLSNGKDPDEAVRKDPVHFRKSVENAEPVYDYIITAAQKTHSADDPLGKKRIGDEVVPYLLRIQNPIVQSHYVKKLAAILSVSEESVRELMKKTRYTRMRRRSFIPKKPHEETGSREELLEKYVLSKLLQSEHPYKLLTEISSILTPADFQTKAYGALFGALIAYQNTHTAYDSQHFAKTLSAALVPSFDELSLYASQQGIEEDAVSMRSVLQLRRLQLKRQLTHVMQSDDEASQEKASHYHKELGEVEKRLGSV